MGSFNTACFITRNSIGEDDPVVIFPIVQNVSGYTINTVQSRKGEVLVPASENECHSTAHWLFNGEMFFGHYCDYGKFVLDETAENERALKSFVDSLRNKNMPHGEESLTKKLDECSSVYQAWGVIQDFQPDIYLPSWDGYPNPVRWAVCSRHAFDAIMDDIEQNPLDFGGPVPWKQRIANLKVIFLEMMEILAETSDENPELGFARRFEMSVREARFDTSHCAGQLDLSNDLARLVRLFLLSGETEEWDDEFSRVFSPLAKLSALYRWLDYVNVKVEPQAYAGQVRDFTRFNRVCQITTEAIKSDYDQYIGDW